MLVSRQGEVLWRYDFGNAGFLRISRFQYSRDGSTIYFYGIREDGSEGIWSIPPQGVDPNLIIDFKDTEISGTFRFFVGPDQLYVTVAERESDILVMDVEVER